MGARIRFLQWTIEDEPDQAGSAQLRPALLVSFIFVSDDDSA